MIWEIRQESRPKNLKMVIGQSIKNLFGDGVAIRGTWWEICQGLIATLREKQLTSEN